jgi:hypothetical protein
MDLHALAASMALQAPPPDPAVVEQRRADAARQASRMQFPRAPRSQGNPALLVTALRETYADACRILASSSGTGADAWRLQGARDSAQSVLLTAGYSLGEDGPDDGGAS